MRQRARLFWTLQIGGWGLYGIAMLLALLPYMKWRQVFAYRGVFTVCCFVASLVLHPICRRLWRAQPGFVKTAALVLTFCSVTGYFSSMAAMVAEMKATPPGAMEETPPSLWLASIGGTR